MSNSFVAGGSSAAITSINGDTTAAQLIVGTAPISATTTSGTTTIVSAAATASLAGHVTTAAQTFAGAKTFNAGIIIPATKTIGFSADPTQAYITDESGAGLLKIHADAGSINLYTNSAETAYFGINRQEMYFAAAAVNIGAWYLAGSNGTKILGGRFNGTTLVPFTTGYSTSWAAKQGATAGNGFYFHDGSDRTNDDSDTRVYSTAANNVDVDAGGVNVINCKATGTTALKALRGVMVTLTDGATVAVDASLGNFFDLVSVQNPTLLTPTNPPSSGVSQVMTVIFTASSSIRTLALTTGATDSYAFGTDIPALSATASGTRDLIGFRYYYSMRRWLVVAYQKGY